MEGSSKIAEKPMTVTCEDCGKKYAVQSTHIGKRVKCKVCGHVFVAAVTAASSKPRAVNVTRKSPPPLPRPAPEPMAIGKPQPAVREEPKPEVVVERSKKPAIILTIVVAGTIAIVGSLVTRTYYFKHGQPEPAELPPVSPNVGPPFSPTGIHDYADEQTLERKTANNLDILTTEVLIYRDRHNGQLPKSLDDLDLHYGGNDPRISPFDKSLGKHGYAYMPINLGPDIDRVLFYDIGELNKRGITHLVMSKYHQIRTMDREQLARQPNVSL